MPNFIETDSFPLTDAVYFGLMSGTSMDGIDGIAVQFPPHQAPRILARHSVDFNITLRDELFALQKPSENEMYRAALAAIALAEQYAQCCHGLLEKTQLKAEQICAIGAHGQTIRHHPEQGFSIQLLNAAHLAEHTQIDVVADFRSRDLAAKGQGAPLVPAFQAAFFTSDIETRVICNLGGISNITILSASNKRTLGFDCGPANVLIDAWAWQHLQQPFDQHGAFAQQGQIDQALLAHLLKEPYFQQSPPKSTGRDLFNVAWLNKQLDTFKSRHPADIQATLTALTAQTIANDIVQYSPDCKAVYICGGGAKNHYLVDQLKQRLLAQLPQIRIQPTDALGVPPQDMEALAFAWLAYRFITGENSNLSTATGALGPRRLGALYPR